MHKKVVTEKKGGNIMTNSNEGMKIEHFHLKTYLNTITKNKVNNSSVETKFDKLCNKVLMYDTIKEVDKETIIKKNIKLLTRDNTN